MFKKHNTENANANETKENRKIVLGSILKKLTKMLLVSIVGLIMWILGFVFGYNGKKLEASAESSETEAPVANAAE